jgi:hypothetical protein
MILTKILTAYGYLPLFLLLIKTRQLTKDRLSLQKSFRPVSSGLLARTCRGGGTLPCRTEKQTEKDDSFLETLFYNFLDVLAY